MGGTLCQRRLLDPPRGVGIFGEMTAASVLLCVSLGLASSPQDTTYRWPLGIAPRISSTFAEFRDGHFHAGIDFGTFRRRGFGVHAIASGYVWRVKTSPVGYGKALYLRLEDGNYVVYAHLSRFSPDVTRNLWDVQRKEGTYHVDAFFPPDAIPVRRGDIVAYTGDTGAGGPHLHFELRDSSHCPVNPLLDEYRVTDTIPPMVRRVALVPLDADSRINGELSRTVVYFRVRNGELVPLKDPPVICGRIGVEAWAYDHIDSSGNRVGAYSLELGVDDRRVFGVTYDRFSYDDFYHLYVHYDRALRLAWKGEYARLYRLPWDRLPFHGTEPGTGVLAAAVEPKIGETPVSAGTHTITVSANDVSGNKRSVDIPVVVNAPPDISIEFLAEERLAVARATDGSGGIARVELFVPSGNPQDWISVAPDAVGDEWRIRLGETPSFVRVVAEDSLGMKSVRHGRWPCDPTDAAQATPLQVSLVPREHALAVDVLSPTAVASDLATLLHLPEGRAVALSLETDDCRHFRGALPLVPAIRGTVVVEARAFDYYGTPLRGTQSVVLQPLGPWQTAHALSPDSLAGVSVTPGDLHYLVYPSFSFEDDGSAGELETVSKAYAVGPPDATFARRIRVFIVLPCDKSHEYVGLFRKQGSKRWSLEGAIYGELGMGEMSALVRELGTFALLRDTKAPSVTSVRPYSGQTVSATPRIEAMVVDRGSGIDYRVSHLKIDGEHVVTEYIPERSRLVGHLAGPLTRGPHTLVVRASDNLGNEMVVERSFSVAG